MNLRLLALAGVAVCAVALPLAVASAGPVRDGGHAVLRSSTHAFSYAFSRDDAKAPSATPSPTRAPLTLGLATAARCGPELSSPTASRRRPVS